MDAILQFVTESDSEIDLGNYQMIGMVTVNDGSMRKSYKMMIINTTQQQQLMDKTPPSPPSQNDTGDSLSN